MRFIEGTDSRQMRLGIWSIEEEVAENSPARFIEVFVDSLDVGALGFKRAEPAIYEKASLYATGFDQTVSVWVSEWDSVIAEAGEGMRKKHRVVLSSEPIASGS